MTVEQLALTASVVFAGLWSGLLGMLTLVMHPMLASMNGAAPRWVTGEAILSLWTARRTLPTSLLYTEDYNTYYALALQLPGITRDAPAAP